MYDVRCSSLPQYSTLVFTGSRPWIHWNNLLYSSQPFYRRLCEKSRCELYANCKFIISVLHSFLGLISLFCFNWIFNMVVFFLFLSTGILVHSNYNLSLFHCLHRNVSGLCHHSRESRWAVLVWCTSSRRSK